MVYKIYNIETNMYIGTTNNNNRDASKECCFEKEVEAFKSVLKTKDAYSNFYSYFYLIPQKKKADFYMIDIADNNARFSIPIAFFKTYQEAKEFVKNFKGDLKLSLSDIKEKEWTQV